MANQLSCAHRVVHGYWHLLESLADNGSGKVQDNGIRVREFAEAMFGGNLPSRRRAYQFFIGWIEDGVAYRSGQPPAVCEPPN